LCFIRKIKRRSLDGVAFAEFDSNPNFVPHGILSNVVACLRNQENRSPCRMDFVHDEIVVDTDLSYQKVQNG